MNYASVYWETLDFKPDNTWDAWHFSQENPAIFAWPIVGWEIQAETLLDPRTGREIDDQPPLTERPRTIVMVDMDNSGVTGNVEEGNQLWKIVPRGTPIPDRAEFEAEWHEWEKQQEHLRSLRRERLQTGDSMKDQIMPKLSPEFVWNSGPGAPRIQPIPGPFGGYDIAIIIDGGYNLEDAQHMTNFWAQQLNDAGLKVAQK